MDERTGASQEALEAGAKQFEQIRDDLKYKLNTLRGIVENVRSAWQGSAAASFTNVTTAWQQRQDDLILVLTNTAEAIRTNGRTLGGSNESARTSMASIDLTALGPSSKGGSQ